jgi:hypothetical protein
MVKRAKRYLTRLAMGLALVAALVVATPGQASAAPGAVPADGYGFGQGVGPVFFSFEDTNRELDAVAQTTANWMRIFVDWSNIEKQRGEFNWGWLDNVVNGARARGLNVLGVITYTPAWARVQGPGALLWTAPPANPADYANFSTTVVQRYGDRIQNWELWNEPNLPFFFGFADRPVQRYTDLIKAAYPAIKAAQPGATVVAGGLSRNSGAGSPPRFLDAMYGAGAGPFFDAANAHPYVFPGGLAANSRNGWSDVLAMRDVMVANGDGGKKIWMTEIGAPTCDCGDGVSQEEQAKQITDVLAAAAGLGYSGPAFIYSIKDTNTGDRGNRERNMGALLTSDWQPKFTAGVLAR